MQVVNQSMCQTEEDTYVCENCGSEYNTILERWRLPDFCYECSQKHPWVKQN